MIPVLTTTLLFQPMNLQGISVVGVSCYAIGYVVCFSSTDHQRKELESRTNTRKVYKRIALVDESFPLFCLFHSTIESDVSRSVSLSACFVRYLVQRLNFFTPNRPASDFSLCQIPPFPFLCIINGSKEIHLSLDMTQNTQDW